MENVIEAGDLTKRYGSILAVDHISSSVEGGETILGATFWF